MKKTILIAAMSMFASATFAQGIANVKELYPEKEKKYFTDAEAKNWKADAEENEMYESYWDIVGGGCSWYCGNGYPTKITASSRLANQGNNNYNEKNLHDLMYNTPWVEGVAGYGEGQWVKYTFEANSPRITEIHVVNGYVKSQAAWKNNSRVKRLKVYVNDKPFAILNLEDSRSDQTFKIDPLNDSKVWTMKFEILEVYKGDKYDDTVLSEVYFDGIDVHCFAAGTKITLADKTLKKIEEITVGDQVLAYNPQTGETFSATVEKTDAVKHSGLVTYHLENGTKITATEDHPFLTNKGWASFNPVKTALYKGYDKVEEIDAGDYFITPTGKLKVKSTSVSTKKQNTYTIVKLSHGQTFIANGVVVGTEEL